MAPKTYPYKNIYPTTPPVRSLVAADLAVVSAGRLKKTPEGQVGREYDAMFAVLQGLVNRQEPRIYLSFAHPEGPGFDDLAWLEYLEERFSIPVRRIDDPFELFEAFGDVVRGVVLYDNAPPCSINVAVMLAGRTNSLPVTAALQEELEGRGYAWAGNVTDDVRGRFANDHELAAWSHETLQPDCYPHIVVHESSVAPFAYDYVVAHNLFLFHSPHNMKNRAGVAVTDSIYQAMDRPAHVMGWLDRYTPEIEYSARIAKNGCFETCNGPGTNLTVHGGIDCQPRFPSRELTDAQKDVEKNVYVTVVISDGDAVWCLYCFFFGGYNHEKRGQVPIGWEMQMVGYHQFPSVLQYYIDSATPNDGFVASVSGAGYTYPNLHPDPASYIKFSEEYMKLTGLHHVFAGIHNPYKAIYWRDTEDDRRMLVDLYHEHMPSARGVLRGYSGGAFLEGSTVDAEQAPFVCCTISAGKAEEILPKIQETIDSTDMRPLFISMHLNNATGPVLEALCEARDALEAQGHEMVLPDEWFAKMQTAAGKGWLDNGLHPDRDRFLAEVRDDNLKSWEEASSESFRSTLEKLALPAEELAETGEEFPLLWQSGQPVNEKVRTFSTLDEDIAFSVLFTGQILADFVAKSHGIHEHDMQTLAGILEDELGHIEDIGVLSECLRAWLDWETAPISAADARILAERLRALLPRLQETLGGSRENQDGNAACPP